MRSPISRARLAVSAVVTAGLCLTGTAGLTTASQAAAGTCDTAYDIADLQPNQAVRGLTVTNGTQPTEFSGTIIGVLQDGIEPDVDMVMAKLSSPEINENGIWEGMSGSPVYDQATGDLIGAVAYTLAWGETQVAGITPWQDMQRYAGQPVPTTLKVPASAARAIAKHTSVTAGQAAQGFTEVATPRLVSGLPQRVLDRAGKSKHGRAFLTDGVSAAGQTAPGEITTADMLAGGNLVATLSTGDIAQAGLGTITSVCNDRVVGFGHPMNFVGRSTYGLAGADALYIQGDPLGASYKVANLGDVLGTVDQDRMTGISGQLGDPPSSSFSITSTLGYTPDSGSASSRTGTSSVQLPDAAAETAFYELLANHQKVLDAYQPGSEEQSWTVKGTSADGAFTFTGSNLYTDTYDIAFGSSWDLPDLLWLLTNVDGVSIDSVDVHADVTDDVTLLKIKGMQQLRGGKWRNVGKGNPARVKAGHALKMRLVFAGGTTGKKFTVHIPAKAAGLRGQLYANPAEGYPFERSFPHRLAGVKKLVDTMQRNDQSAISFFAYGDRHSVRSSALTPRQGTVIEGRTAVKVKIS
jgi:hypothetical protein